MQFVEDETPPCFMEWHWVWNDLSVPAKLFTNRQLNEPNLFLMLVFCLFFSSPRELGQNTQKSKAYILWRDIAPPNKEEPYQLRNMDEGFQQRFLIINCNPPYHVIERKLLAIVFTSLSVCWDEKNFNLKLNIEYAELVQEHIIWESKTNCTSSTTTVFCGGKK